MQAALIEKLDVETENNQPRLLFYISGLRPYAKNVQRLRGHLVRKPLTSSSWVTANILYGSLMIPGEPSPSLTPSY